jgi:RHS repeat-associated protein
VLNHPIRVTDALNHHTTFDYDTLTRLVQTTDPVAAVTQFRYDDFNRLISSVDALTGVSSQGFDADGNRTHLTDPNQNDTYLEFDLSSRLVQETVATGNQVKYSYNARNLLAQVLNARGQPRQLEYDATGRVTHFTDIDGTVSFTYDNNGNVLTVSDSQGTITRTYDALNRVTSYTDVNGNTLRYQYDAVGNLVALTYPDGKLVHYEYDANDQLVKVTDWAERETHYEYDANGRLRNTTRPNGTRQTRQYDAKGQLLAQTDLDVQGNVLVAYTFSYDAAGNLLQEQVTPELLPVLPASVKMTYTAANRLATYNGQAVQFDADGNLVSGPLAGGGANFVFDSRNRLTQAGNTTYRYDAENQRIGVNQTNYVVNSQPTLSQVLVKAENGVKTFYVYGLGLLGEEKEGEYRSYLFDFRGSTVALTDNAGKVAQRFQYGPHGELEKGEVTVTPFLFNGRYGVMTEGNGLSYMRARYYSPDIKRFVNMDVLLGKVSEGQTLNRYAFVTGQPVSLVDPFGLEQEQTPQNEKVTLVLAISGLFIPGPGELLDIDVLFGVTQSTTGWEKLGAGSSLFLSALTLGTSPNYGSVARCGDEAKRILNIGSGNRPIKEAINMDIVPGKGVDVLADVLAKHLPFKSGSIDKVMAEALPSHLIGRYGEKVAENIYEVLKPGGTVFLTSRTHFHESARQIFLDAGFTEVNVRDGVLTAIK